MQRSSFEKRSTEKLETADSSNASPIHDHEHVAAVDADFDGYDADFARRTMRHVDLRVLPILAALYALSLYVVVLVSQDFCYSRVRRFHTFADSQDLIALIVPILPTHTSPVSLPHSFVILHGLLNRLSLSRCGQRPSTLHRRPLSSLDVDILCSVCGIIHYSMTCLPSLFIAITAHS